MVAGVLAMTQGSLAADRPDTGNFVWKPVRGDTMPPDAFSAAPDNGVWICRVRHNRDIEIGHIENSLCAIGGDGMSRPYSLFYTLVHAPGAAWVAVSDGAVPANAVALNDGFGPDVFTCRVSHDGRMVVGMVRDKICSAGFDGNELRADKFEVLVLAK